MITVFQRIRCFWEDRKKTRLGQLHLLWIISFAISTFTAIRETDLPVRERVLISIVGSLVVFFGLIIMYLLPLMYLAYIRKRKEEGRSVIGHRVLFGIYCFPFIPWLFMAFIALIMNLGLIIK